MCRYLYLVKNYVSTPWKALPRKRVRDAPKTVVAIVRFMIPPKVHNYIEKVYHSDTLLVSTIAEFSQHFQSKFFWHDAQAQSYSNKQLVTHSQK